MGSTPPKINVSCWKRSALSLEDMCSTSRIVGALKPFAVFPIGSLPFKYYRYFPVNHDFVGRKGDFVGLDMLDPQFTVSFCVCVPSFCKSAPPR